MRHTKKVAQQSTLYYKEFTVSYGKVGIKVPLTNEAMQSKPLITEVSPAATPSKPARPQDAVRVLLNMCVASGENQHHIEAAVCIPCTDIGKVASGRHAVMIRQYPDGIYATHLTANGMHIPLLHP